VIPLVKVPGLVVVIQNQPCHTSIKQWTRLKRKLLKFFKRKSQGIKKCGGDTTKWNVQLHRHLREATYYINSRHVTPNCHLNNT